MSETDQLINTSTQNPSPPPYNASYIWYDNVVRPLLAEVIGVTLYVFIGCCSLTFDFVEGLALCHGLTFAVLMVIFGNIRLVNFKSFERFITPDMFCLFDKMVCL